MNPVRFPELPALLRNEGSLDGPPGFQGIIATFSPNFQHTFLLDRDRTILEHRRIKDLIEWGKRMEAKEFDEKYRKRFEKLATTNLADALDKVGIRGAVIGIRPLYERSKIIGRAVTIKITAVGMAKSKYHLGVRAIDAASPGDVIVIDNRGGLYNNCWGEILSMGAR
jgi:hypothetical protein